MVNTIFDNLESSLRRRQSPLTNRDHRFARGSVRLMLRLQPRRVMISRGAAGCKPWLDRVPGCWKRLRQFDVCWRPWTAGTPNHDFLRASDAPRTLHVQRELSDRSTPDFPQRAELEGPHVRRTPGRNPFVRLPNAMPLSRERR